jgi:hypothetical protein
MQFIQRLRRSFYRLETVSGWIQVEHQLIGIIELVYPAEPDVRSQASLIAAIHKRRSIVADDVPDGTSCLLFYRHRFIQPG